MRAFLRTHLAPVLSAAVTAALVAPVAALATYTAVSTPTQVIVQEAQQPFPDEELQPEVRYITRYICAPSTKVDATNDVQGGSARSGDGDADNDASGGDINQSASASGGDGINGQVVDAVNNGCGTLNVHAENTCIDCKAKGGDAEAENEAAVGAATPRPTDEPDELRAADPSLPPEAEPTPDAPPVGTPGVSPTPSAPLPSS